MDDYKKLYERYKTWVPPGHFYSPIHKMKEVNEYATLKKNFPVLPGLNYSLEAQFLLFQKLFKRFGDIPHFSELSEVEGLMYDVRNTMFGQGDAITLGLMLMDLNPKSIIEVGSGFSSAFMLDLIHAKCFKTPENLIFVEPYPDRLKNLVSDESSIELIEKKVQKVELRQFEILGENDILFIDSTHVSKAGSDVNHIFFQILPVLSKGVVIHFHDIGHEFEYPYNWLKQGRAWNEGYLLRSFLMFNDTFEVMIHNPPLVSDNKEWFERECPQFLSNPGGSIWLKKVK